MIRDKIGFQTFLENMSETDGVYTLSIPDSWRQGRTVYGGLTAGLMLAATQRTFKDLPPLRSAQINFTGPVMGDPTMTATLLRQGRNVTTIRTDMICEGSIAASCFLTFGAKRESDLYQTLEAPSLEPPNDCQPFTPPEMANFVPIFFHNFETRLIAGGRPMSGSKDAYVRAWSRHADERSRQGDAAFLTIGDVLPPAAMPTFTKMGPISSMNWQLNILVDELQTEDGWWQVETQQTAAQGGYSSQIMRFWNRSGELVAEGIQSVAIFI